MLLNFVLAESALELVPGEVRRSQDVVADAKRREKDPSDILLDRSFHDSAMLKLKDSEKRGRPDLVHVALLSVTGTPLYLEGNVRVFVHTYPDVVLEMEKATRIPKNYFRFRGLMEKALAERPEEGLVKVYEGGVGEVLSGVSPDAVVGLSVQGKMTGLRSLAERLALKGNPTVVVGGFAHGHFSPRTLKAIGSLERVDPKPLEAHVVASRLVYEVERAAGRIND